MCRYEDVIYFNTVVNAITVESFTTTSVTFQSPTWSTDIPDGAQVKFTVYVRPAGASSPQGGYPNSCTSSAGQHPNQWDSTQFMEYHYANGEDECMGKVKGETCNEGICNDSLDSVQMRCDRMCPFPSQSGSSPCFDKNCYINGSFHPELAACGHAVDMYCSENPENPGCATFGVCTFQCADTCNQVSPKFTECPNIESEPILVAIEFSLREGDCDFDASCTDPKECISKSIWKTRQTETSGSSVGDLADSYGISTMVKSCIGEYFQNFGRYEYYLSTADTYIYQNNERCSSSYRKGGAKATIIDTDAYTAAEALNGIQALASSKACLDLIPAEDLKVSITGYSQNGLTCGEGARDLKCPGGDSRVTSTFYLMRSV